MPGDETSSCWSCGTMRAVHFCSSCGKVQPPVPVDYFTFFGFPRKLNLDTAALEKEFINRKIGSQVGSACDRSRHQNGIEDFATRCKCFLHTIRSWR